MPATWDDAEGYSWGILAGAKHPAKNWIVRLEVYQQNRVDEKSGRHYWDGDYWLKIQVDGETRVNWRPETYNPYFGCDPYYLYWRDDAVIFVYGEKHRIYGCTIALNEDVKITEIGRSGYETSIYDDVVYCWKYNHKQAKTIMRFALPDWQTLPEWSIEQAIEAGIVREV